MRYNPHPKNRKRQTPRYSCRLAMSGGRGALPARITALFRETADVGRLGGAD